MAGMITGFVKMVVGFVVGVVNLALSIVGTVLGFLGGLMSFLLGSGVLVLLVGLVLYRRGKWAEQRANRKPSDAPNAPHVIEMDDGESFVSYYAQNR